LKLLKRYGDSSEIFAFRGFAWGLVIVEPPFLEKYPLNETTELEQVIHTEPSPSIQLANDPLIDIAIGKYRKTKTWKNKQILLSGLYNRASRTHRTAETYAEYMAAEKHRQDEIKDVGGFVGGYLNRGQRKNESVGHRQLLTLDIDHGKADTWDDIQLMGSNSAALDIARANEAMFSRTIWRPEDNSTATKPETENYTFKFKNNKHEKFYRLRLIL
jgi:hypothetical protein